MAQLIIKTGRTPKSNADGLRAYPVRIRSSIASSLICPEDQKGSIESDGKNESQLSLDKISSKKLHQNLA